MVASSITVTINRSDERSDPIAPMAPWANGSPFNTGIARGVSMLGTRAGRVISSHATLASSVLSFFAVVASHALCTTSHAQSYAEGFESVGADTGSGPSELVAREFEFRRLLDPSLGHEPWTLGPWYAGAPVPWEGAGYLYGGVSVPPFVSGNFVKWIILPPIPGQQAGSVASLWARGFTTGTFPMLGSVELRYAPTQGISTGVTTASVGDFTEVVATNTNSIFSSWDHLQGKVPGSGRLAIRWSGFAPFSFSGTALNFLADDLTVTTTGVTPPLPQSGETVHWTVAMSPIHLTNQQVIPNAATLVIDAGVEIWFDFNSEMFTGPEIVAFGGTIRFEGTAKNPVRLRRGVNTPNLPSVGAGSGTLATVGTTAMIDANFVDSDISLGGGSSAFVRVRNSVFHRAEPIDWISMTDSQWQTPRIGGGKCTARIESCVFRNAIVELDDALSIVSGCTFDDALLRVERFPMSQSHAITGNTFVNSTRYTPLDLGGYDFHLAQNTIEGNLWPLSLNGSGLTPDSVIPASGNTNNRVPFGGASGSEIVGPLHLPPMSVPYLIRSQLTAGDQYDPIVTFEAGSTIEMGPNSGILFEGVARTEIRGRPEAPVRFVPEISGQRWITVSTAASPPLTMRNAVFEGGRWAAGGVDTLYFVHDCEFRGNEIGVQVGDLCGAVISKSRFIDNGKGCFAPWAGASGIDQGMFFHYGAANFNSFEGTGVGATTEPPTTAFSEIKDAWWGAVNGPQHWTNPSGQGAVAGEWVRVLPYRTQPVDFTDHPPVVDAMPIAKRLLRAGDTIILHWDATDAGTVVSQRLEFRPNRGFNDGIVAVRNIAPTARSLELVIPDTLHGDPVLGADLGLAVFRLIATDDKGQEGWDEFSWSLAKNAAFDVNFTGDFTPVRRVGENFDVPVSLGGTLDYSLHADDIPGDMQLLGTSGLDNNAGGLAAFQNTMPALSTDLARYVAHFAGEDFYSPYFSIRPRAEFGDSAPVVALTSPLQGASYSGGGVVPIRWTASDGEGLRDFDLQASYDGGRTWHPFERGLPAKARSYDWQLPASAGIAEVRVRVLARDNRFQVSSDGTTRTFSIVAGLGGCLADLNANGSVDATDLALLLSNWGQSGVGDLDHNGVVSATDLAVFLAAWGACP